MALPATIAPFDPFQANLSQSSWRLGVKDRLTLIDISARLCSYYDGNQEFYLHEYLGALIRNAELLRRYKTLCDWHNLTRLVVDKVTVMGRDPLSVHWETADGKADKKSDELWTKVAAQIKWDLVMQTIGHRTELCKTCVAVPSWDERAEKMKLDHYTPNVLDVGYIEGNYDVERPDYYRILKSEGGGAKNANVWQVWDYSGEDTSEYAAQDSSTGEKRPASARVYEQIGDQFMGEPKEWKPVQIIDPRTGLSLRPFVAFRTTMPWRHYYPDDGQMEIIRAQEAVNRIMTAEQMALWHGAHKQPILEGGGWKGKDGQEDPQLVADWGAAIVAPTPNVLSGIKPTIRWDGPASAEVVEHYEKAIDSRIGKIEASFHLTPQSLQMKYSGASGYALFISQTGLREKQRRTATLVNEPLDDLVWCIRLIWNNYHPDPAEQFPPDSVHKVVLPDLQFAQDPATKIATDVQRYTLYQQAAAMGVEWLRKALKEHEPELDPEDVARLVSDAMATQQKKSRSLFSGRTPAVPAQPPGSPAAVPQGENQP